MYGGRHLRVTMMNGGMRRGNYLHPAQDEDEQPPQPDPDEEAEESPPEDRPMPKRDRRFSVSVDPHFSQATLGLAPKTSFSKSALQDLQWYS